MSSKVKLLAEVQSSSHKEMTYAVALYNRHVQCTCRDFFFRRRPCKHIQALRTLQRVAVGDMVLKKVRLTKHGVAYLRRWRERHEMPLVRPEGYTPPSKDKRVELLR